MMYMKVLWKHTDASYPVELWSEIDVDRNETRKIDIFADGSMTAAGKEFSSGATGLGLIPTPEIEEINKDSEFFAQYVQKTEFESIWELVVR